MRYVAVSAFLLCGLSAFTGLRASATELTITGFVCEGAKITGFTVGESTRTAPCKKPLSGAIIRFGLESGSGGVTTLATTDPVGRFNFGPIGSDSSRRYCLSAQQARYQRAEICLPQPMLAQLAGRVILFALTIQSNTNLFAKVRADGHGGASYREWPGQSELPASSESLELTTPWQVGGSALTRSLQVAYDQVELRDLSGQQWDARVLRGKVALIIFWNLACRPCRQELPSLRALYESHHAEGLEIIGISDDDPGEFRRFVAKNEVTWPQALVDNLEDPRIAAFHVAGTPSMFVVDRTGKVQSGVDHFNFESRVRSLLGTKR